VLATSISWSAATGCAIADIWRILGQFVLEKNEEATEQPGPVHAGWGIDA